MRITIAHSPDSDDAFMFYGLASGKVPTGDLEIVHVLSDIETLNRAAFEGKYEISAVSFHAYAHLTDKYILLPHGASMGDNYGPMVVVRNDGPTSLDGVRVAIPGTLTTAFLALRLYKPDVEYVVLPFDEILEAVRDGKVEAGLLIHEGQLTYEHEGLRKLLDFGEWWADRTGGLPLPLGGNVIRRDLGPELIGRLSRIDQRLASGAGAEARIALGWVIVGGLGLATLSTLFLTPVAYLLLGRFVTPKVEEAVRLKRELDQAANNGRGSEQPAE